MRSGPTWFKVNEVYFLEYREESLAWHNRWISLRQGADPWSLVHVAGVSADRIEPPAADVEMFYGEDIAAFGGICSPDGDDPCGPEERLALAVPVQDGSAWIFDGQAAVRGEFPGVFFIWNEVATRPAMPDVCEDTPPAWFQAMFHTQPGQ